MLTFSIYLNDRIGGDPPVDALEVLMVFWHLVPDGVPVMSEDTRDGANARLDGYHIAVASTSSLL